jgi:HlyD family secretion protein
LSEQPLSERPFSERSSERPLSERPPEWPIDQGPSTPAPLVNGPGLKLIGIVSALALGVVGLSSYILIMRPAASSDPAASPSASASPVAGGIGALGRLEPEGEVYKVAGPTSAQGGGRVLKVLVKEGQSVKAGQHLAYMDSAPSLEQTMNQAKAQVIEAQTRLEQVKAGAKQGDIQAQQASLQQAIANKSEAQAKLKESESALAEALAELKKRAWDYEKYQKLLKDGAVSEAEFRKRDLDAATQQQKVQQAAEVINQRKQAVAAADAAIGEAGNRFRSVQEVRPTDVDQAQAQILMAQVNLKKAEVDLENAIVKAPVDAQVLKINAKDNESVGTNGILELGRTSQMYAVAEIDENLVGRIKPGQQAVIRSDAFEGEVTGTVERLGNRVGKNAITSSDPADKQDNRVVEVKIRLNDSAKVARFTNLQVKVAIQP